MTDIHSQSLAIGWPSCNIMSQWQHGLLLDRHGWLGLDPPHHRVVGALYARIAIVRDYTDAAPIRRIYQGCARKTLAVRVRRHTG
jgi:transglutaminase-like putative cysteine protease